MPFLGAALLPNAYDLPKCDIRMLLVDFIRDVAALTGTHISCTYEGVCGSCTVQLNLIPKLPYVTATGVNYDSGDFLKVWDFR